MDQSNLTSTNIHPTAIISNAAVIGAGVSIGAYCVVGDNAVLGDGVKLMSHVVIDGHTSIGAGTEIYPFAVLGCAPQHTRYEGEPSTLEIGENCVIREHVTMHPGTAIDKMRTIIGNNGLFFAGAHVAHDCIVGDNVIFANNASLGGHAKIGDNVMLGGYSAVQQHCRVGNHCMLGAHSLVDSDVVPFSIAVGNRARLSGINVIGLGRRGFSSESVNALRAAFQMLFEGDDIFASRVETTRAHFADIAEVQDMIAFIDGAGRNGICQAAKR
ncbi:acyl-ACP--UDP-N-acetylglucosamine O-acyltransferase [Alphaproteobacteria bacterium]|nr:acyl-ACP--UDP-N-acetylglucosamine O-acyltransferase [Alphaproteobacteria bacterium]